MTQSGAHFILLPVSILFAFVVIVVLRRMGLGEASYLVGAGASFVVFMVLQSLMNRVRGKNAAQPHPSPPTESASDNR